MPPSAQDEPGRRTRVRPAAEVVARALRPREDRGSRHRRLVEPRSAVSSSWDAGGEDAAEIPWSTFRGATARFVSFG